MTEPVDQAARDRAITTRERTVIIDAGAGAGKTSILVARIIRLVAPVDDAHAPMAILRMAAVTFTRRAAGELRLRVREGLLRELTHPGVSDVRRRRLLDALGNLDAAMLGTIHGFADRLLRLQPMKARLSPSYQVVDSIDALVEETVALLLHAVQSGTLAAELAGHPTTPPTYAAEVERTLQEALRSGMLVRSKEQDPLPTRVGLDLLVRGFIEHRDRDITWQGDGTFDHAAFAAAATAFATSMQGVIDDGLPGTRWLIRLEESLQSLQTEADPLVLYELVARIASGKKRFKKTKHFAKKSVAKAAFEAFTDQHAEQLSSPLRAVMARRLARTRHAVIVLYERIKARHEVLDSVDLLLALRNLLRDDLGARGFYQGRFDHLLVDELQDTDPLQAEIVLYLAEHAPLATRWQDVVVGPGRLTLVGDPKQSIYRFRRADIGMYEQIRTQIARFDHVPITLAANFRSVPELIAWGNDRFSAILGLSATAVFDPATGQVFHQPQQPARASLGTPPVHALSYRFPDGEPAKVGPARALEGEAIAAYLHWLVSASGREILDPDTHVSRPIRWGDIAVLALVTSNLPHLFTALDVRDVPYAMSGGVLFTSDPLHRQFVLGLRAIADRNDGVAEAALLRPPFFAIDLLDLVRERALATDEPAARATAARNWVQELRRDRFARSPGQTARMLLEQTGIGRATALGANGPQRLANLRQLCVQLELIAAADGLDYDGVTARLRDWIDQPQPLDPPRPIGAAAIQVLTVHQAKGLEFPVVVLWDGMGLWRPHDVPIPWRVDRDGAGWSMKTNDVTWEEPAGNALLARESAYAASERRRLVYVAATRARDLLVIPRPAWDQPTDKYIHATLLANARPDWIHELAPFVAGEGAAWAPPLPPPRVHAVVDDDDLEARWSAARDAARSSRHAPRSVTALAKAPPVTLRIDDAEVETPAPRVVRIGRFGALFGDVVHRAIGLVLTRQLDAPAAVARAASTLALADHHAEATEDVERALVALREAHLLDRRVVRLEYPVAAHRDGLLVSGYIDLISAAVDDPTDRVVIDFKTDRWPRNVDAVTEAFPAYVTQVRSYGEIVGASRTALLFTSIGRLSWT
ncbi:MAG: UvrD-helicase domain-containing protein [Proteobacteria bacterium]|nr:UvrD-helicase domain-containing protein [Pseudomonadota bacterium]